MGAEGESFLGLAILLIVIVILLFVLPSPIAWVLIGLWIIVATLYKPHTKAPIFSLNNHC